MQGEMTKDSIISTIVAHKDEFRRKYGVQRIGLFGSQATGDSAQDSDIDIVVELEKPDLFSLVSIKETLEKTLGNRVDVVRMRERMNSSLRRRIQRDAIYV
jgi:predicted nucleotidyltransferase